MEAKYIWGTPTPLEIPLEAQSEAAGAVLDPCPRVSYPHGPESPRIHREARMFN